MVYMKKILNKLLFLFIKAIATFLAWALFRLKVEGKDNLPKDAPFIVASNHTSFLDPGLIQIAIPARMSWITKKDVYENWYLKPLCWVSESIPINGAIEKALVALEEGRVLGIFPEGTRSRNGKLKDADTGIAILALRSGRPVLPIGIKGAFEAFPPGKNFFKPYPIVVKIGKPFSFEKKDKENIEESILNEKKDYVMDRIEELLI